MNLTTALYLTDLISNIDCILGIPLIFGGVALIVASICKVICQDEYVDRSGLGENLWDTILKKWWVLAIVAVLNAFFPGKNTMYMMLGASYLQASNLPAKVSQVLEIKLDDYLKELTDKKESK